jgi:hypothetical protein
VIVYVLVRPFRTCPIRKSEDMESPLRLRNVEQAVRLREGQELCLQEVIGWKMDKDSDGKALDAKIRS